MQEIEISMEETVESVGNILCQTSEFHNYIQIASNNNDIDPAKSIVIKSGDNYICPECRHSFTYTRTLKQHVKRKHPPLTSILFPSDDCEKTHKCNDCGKSYKHLKSLQVHKNRIHNLVKKLKKHKCPLCPLEFERRHFDEHFEKCHNLLLKPFKLNFDNFEKFCEWKKTIERVTKTYYTKCSGKKARVFVYHMFACHRFGIFKSEGQQKRKLKAQGSKKIGAFCPAFMKAVVKTDGICEVTFESQHIGHDNELHHLSLTNEERMFIADRLATNLPLNVVLNDIHNSASYYGSGRLSLLTKKDLHNIKASFLNGKQFNAMETNEELENILRDIHNKHDESEQIRADISKIEKGWVLTFADHNEIYLIRENLKSCGCFLICIHCKLCVNSYFCSCPDSAILGNMCQHIHFFCMEQKKIQDVPDNSDSLKLNNDCLDDNNEISEYNIDSLDNNNDVGENSNLKQCGNLQARNTYSNSEFSKNDKAGNIVVDSEKRKTLKHEFSDLVDSITNEEEYKLFKTTVEDLTTNLKLIRSQSTDELFSNLEPIESHSVDQSISKRKAIESNSADESISKLKPSQSHSTVELITKLKPIKSYFINKSTTKLKPTQSCSTNKSTAKSKPIQSHSTDKDKAVISATNPPLQSVPVSKSLQVQINSNSSKILQQPLVLQILNPSAPGAKYCYLEFAKAKTN